MPAKSKAQLRWVNSPAGHAALGSSGVEEWNQATKGKKLPERLTPQVAKPFTTRVKSKKGRG